MRHAEVHFCSAGEDEAPLREHAPSPRGNQRRPAESLDPVAAIDIRVGLGTEHHDIHIGIGSRRASGVTAYEGHRAHVLAGVREGQHGHKEPLDVLGEPGAHDNIIARGFSFEAGGVAPADLSSLR